MLSAGLGRFGLVVSRVAPAARSTSIAYSGQQRFASPEQVRDVALYRAPDSVQVHLVIGVDQLVAQAGNQGPRGAPATRTTRFACARGRAGSTPPPTPTSPGGRCRSPGRSHRAAPSRTRTARGCATAGSTPRAATRATRGEDPCRDYATSPGSTVGVLYVRPGASVPASPSLARSSATSFSNRLTVSFSSGNRWM